MAISEERVKWTRSELKGGATIEETRRALEEQGFTAKDVKYALKKAAPRADYKKLAKPEAAQAGSKSSYLHADYRALAEPKLVRDAGNSNVTTLFEDELQLYAIRNFLSARQCEQLVNAIKGDAHPSKVDSYDQQSDMRSSRTCSLRIHEHPFVGSINTAIANTLGLSNTWAEVTQGQWYEPGQQYKPHPDYFVPGTAEYDRFAKTGGQRTWTFMIYLNQPEAGGGTHFLKVDETILPEQGMAICWNNLLRSGAPNPNTVHAGLPVEAGSKFIITKWFRDRGTGQPFTA
ncbi:2OG-Fe(II) oxygenase [Congregibacter brevis]|uniref:2OG-Fe(II) oxygenase n=1 Tax=Congregibacter brevis TaxID=3081201 RepID=A0ABZ0IBM5_9GAMM|nr:2OG-Fe(II) oxygenase [Congregibacter sp. IMCC45268]